jgi:hypothetical protein
MTFRFRDGPTRRTTFLAALVSALALANPAVAVERRTSGSDADSLDLNVEEAAVNCRAVSTRAMTALQSSLKSAYSAAQADAAKNGSTGQYAVAATNSRDLIKRALDRSDRMLADHNKIDPRTTTYAEAGTMKEHARAIIEVLPQAAHWATISNIYHKSPDARRAFDLAVNALEQGRQLFVDAGHCYMDGFP